MAERFSSAAVFDCSCGQLQYSHADCWNPPKDAEWRQSVRQSNVDIRQQEARVQALLDAPGETDWSEYEREVGILLHMMPVEQPAALPERHRRSRAWLAAIFMYGGLSGVLCALFFGHDDPTLLTAFAGMMGMPVLLYADPSSDKL